MPTTSITRRDILDYVTADERSWFCGRLQPVEFLSRIFDLESMPSQDARFAYAKDDLVQHLVANDDYDDHFLLYEYFDLVNADDATFFKFIEEYVHPEARPDSTKVARIVSDINACLRGDGYGLVEVGQLSGRAIYRVEDVSLDSQELLKYRSIALRLGEMVKYSHVVNQIERAAQSVFAFRKIEYPNDAISSVRAQVVWSWVMTLCRTVSDERRRLELLGQFIRELVTDEELLQEVHSALKALPTAPPASPDGDLDFDNPETAFEYDVALSYASEEGVYVEQVAKLLEAESIAIFYDKHNQAEIWGKRLEDYLRSVYQSKARYCMMFVSRHYRDKVWPTTERESALARSLCQEKEYILPVLIDQTEIEGITDGTLAFVTAQKYTPRKLAELVISKLRSPGTQPKGNRQ